MQKAREFFLVCAGIFLLALAYHLDANSASAQQGSQPLGLGVAVNQGAYQSWEDIFVITPNGDVFQRSGTAGWKSRGPAYIGNFWSGTTPAQPRSER